MSNNQIPLINPISGKILSKSILDFSSLDTLIDYLYTQESSFQRQLAVNTDLDHINSTDDPFCKTNILIIDQNGELLTTSLFFRLHNFKNAKFYAFNKSIFFGKNENSNIDDYLNHIVDPLPTLIKPVKPSSNSKVLLESWAVALELDVQSYFSIIERFHDTEYDIYKQGLRSIMNFLIVYCKGNVLAEDKITTDEVSNFSFDIHALKANFKNIEIDQTNSLIDIIDYDLFEQYYFKFKDLKQKINTFKQNIIIKDYEAILNALTKFEYFVNQLITKFDHSFDRNLDFDIDSLMFEKFSTLIEHKSGNLFTSQIDNLYTIANSLFVKSTEILIMKRNIQKEILSIDYNSILKKMVSLKKIIDSDFNENMNLLVHRYDTLKYIEFDIPLIYGMNLLESVRRKIIFKTKYYLKFSSLIVNNNDWLEEDLKIEYDIRNNYLSNLEELENISFLNKKMFNNKFQIKNTFSDLRKLQKYITLGEYDDNDADDEELDIETRNLLSYCDYLEHNNYESLAKELLVSFEDMKGELLNNSEIEQQMNKSKVESLENEVEELKAKLILQDLIETDDWPVEMSSLSIKQESPLVESVNNNYEENKTIKLLNEQLKTSTEKNVFMENKLNETILMFKQDFNIASKMNSELIKENEDLKLMLSKSENDNRNLHDRMKNLLYKDISLLEKIGLLLDIDNMQVNRVKGLKNQQSNMMSSTILLPKNEELSLKADIDKLNELKNIDDMIKFEDSFRELFNESIVKRFSDVEELAKKYTKENKQMKKHIKHLEDSV
ncbi:hypothetical protein DAHU10_021250 [Hanseniaspora uvarum]|nr:hypothetical protein DAHU10_021250 [Hanseniaspora uvarum]